MRAMNSRAECVRPVDRCAAISHTSSLYLPSPRHAVQEPPLAVPASIACFLLVSLPRCFSSLLASSHQVNARPDAWYSEGACRAGIGHSDAGRSWNRRGRSCSKDALAQLACTHCLLPHQSLESTCRCAAPLCRVLPAEMPSTLYTAWEGSRETGSGKRYHCKVDEISGGKSAGVGFPTCSPLPLLAGIASLQRTNQS